MSGIAEGGTEEDEIGSPPAQTSLWQRIFHKSCPVYISEKRERKASDDERREDKAVFSTTQFSSFSREFSRRFLAPGMIDNVTIMGECT